MTRLENLREFKPISINERNSITKYITKLVKNSMYMLTLEMMFAVLVFSAVAIMIFLCEEAVNELVRGHIGILGGIFALCYIYTLVNAEKKLK